MNSDIWINLGLVFFAAIALLALFKIIDIKKKQEMDNRLTMMQESPRQDDSEIGDIVQDRITKGTGVSKEIAIIKAMIARDSAYAWSWYCNLVMSFVDAGGDKIIAMEGSARFLSVLAEIDVTRDPRYIEEMKRLKEATRSPILIDGEYHGLWHKDRVVYEHHGVFITHFMTGVESLKINQPCMVVIKDGVVSVEPARKSHK